jgi:hypothetical protein
MIAAIILIVINIMILMKTGIRPTGAVGSADWTVYGTMGCGWTRKQLKYMEDKGIPHTFVDCDTGECSGMNAFPTMRHNQTGEKIVGFKKV